MITVIELFEKLGNQAEKIFSGELKGRERREALKDVDATAKISKQALNAANVIVKADKMAGRHDRIDRIVG